MAGYATGSLHHAGKLLIRAFRFVGAIVRIPPSLVQKCNSRETQRGCVTVAPTQLTGLVGYHEKGSDRACVLSCLLFSSMCVHFVPPCGGFQNVWRGSEWYFCVVNSLQATAEVENPIHEAFPACLCLSWLFLLALLTLCFCCDSFFVGSACPPCSSLSLFGCVGIF